MLYMVMFHIPTTSFSSNNWSGVENRLKKIHVQVGTLEVFSKELCQKVYDMILQDRRIKVSVIAHELGISAGTVSSLYYVKGQFPMGTTNVDSWGESMTLAI